MFEAGPRRRSRRNATYLLADAVLESHTETTRAHIIYTRIMNTHTREKWDGYAQLGRRGRANARISISSNEIWQFDDQGTNDATIVKTRWENLPSGRVSRVFVGICRSCKKSGVRREEKIQIDAREREKERGWNAAREYRAIARRRTRTPTRRYISQRIITKRKGD